MIYVSLTNLFLLYISDKTLDKFYCTYYTSGYQHIENTSVLCILQEDLSPFNNMVFPFKNQFYYDTTSSRVTAFNTLTMPLRRNSPDA